MQYTFDVMIIIKTKCGRERQIPTAECSFLTRVPVLLFFSVCEVERGKKEPYPHNLLHCV